MSQRVAGEVQWPPRSPHDALLSTPGGRDRLRRLANRTSPSPSPIRRSKSTPSFALEHDFDGGDVDSEDEDEETLQLKLQEIQARLKLKKLQKAKSKEKVGSDTENDAPRAEARPLSRAYSAASTRNRQDIAELKEHRLERSKSQVSVHVPASPTRRVQKQEVQRSPSRILLGIDKGLKASDVSLGRAPSSRKTSDNSMINAQRAGGYLQRASSQATQNGVYLPDGRPLSAMHKERVDKVKTTFSERMVNSRTEDAERREKDARIRQARSKAFDIDEKEMERFKAEAASVPEVQMKPPEFSRDQILDTYNKPASGLLQRSKSTSQITSTTRTSTESRNLSTTSAASAAPRSSRANDSITPANESQDPSVFESFSSLHLSKRIIPHSVLTRTLTDKKTFTIPDLLKLVVAPAFELPEVEGDIVLLAVIASKSDPKNHKAKGKTTNEENKKFMAMTLTDLKWELDLYLFGTAFEKFWKLMPGTVIAILNPGLMPPLKADTGKFSMTLNSSDDTVLEIGNSRDLGFCKSVKKDGSTCDSWIDKRHTEHCEFHINETLKKTKAGRMEVNTMDFGGRNKSGIDGRHKYNSQQVSNFDRRPQKKDGSMYNRETHSRVFMSRGGRTTADLFDDADVDPDAFHRVPKEERMRRQLATIEKERELARKLAKVGGGLGADYMRSRDQPAFSSSGTLDGPPAPPDAAALGLLDGKADAISLSPMKRKRTGTNPLDSNSAMGWGGNMTKELGRMKDGERLQPIKKKTRFVTAKGIREAGRESFGPDLNTPIVDDDDDDDLDIIK